MLKLRERSGTDTFDVGFVGHEHNAMLGDGVVIGTSEDVDFKRELKAASADGSSIGAKSKEDGSLERGAGFEVVGADITHHTGS